MMRDEPIILPFVTTTHTPPEGARGLATRVAISAATLATWIVVVMFAAIMTGIAVARVEDFFAH